MNIAALKSGERLFNSTIFSTQGVDLSDWINKKISRCGAMSLSNAIKFASHLGRSFHYVIYVRCAYRMDVPYEPFYIDVPEQERWKLIEKSECGERHSGSTCDSVGGSVCKIERVR